MPKQKQKAKMRKPAPRRISARSWLERMSICSCGHPARYHHHCGVPGAKDFEVGECGAESCNKTARGKCRKYRPKRSKPAQQRIPAKSAEENPASAADSVSEPS